MYTIACYASLTCIETGHCVCESTLRTSGAGDDSLDNERWGTGEVRFTCSSTGDVCPVLSKLSQQPGGSHRGDLHLDVRHSSLIHKIETRTSEWQRS